MLNEKICKLREKLDESIKKNLDYSIIYKLSVELDDLIAQYYLENHDSKIKQNKKKQLTN